MLQVGHPAPVFSLPDATRAGVKHYYACRGGAFEKPPVFMWEAPDGSRVLVNYETAWYLNRVGPHLAKYASSLGLAFTADTALLLTLFAAGCLALVVAAVWLIGVTRRLTHHSIWSHEHFTGAVLAQFFYVAAQAGIFSFLINYGTSEPPTLPASWLKADSKWVQTRTGFAGSDFKDMPALAARLIAPSDPLRHQDPGRADRRAAARARGLRKAVLSGEGPSAVRPRRTPASGLAALTVL